MEIVGSIETRRRGKSRAGCASRSRIRARRVAEGERDEEGRWRIIKIRKRRFLVK
jgi:hypothetical protein